MYLCSVIKNSELAIQRPRTGSSNATSRKLVEKEWGKDAVEMTPGIVIAIPAEVKHWHGAAKDSWFQHLTYHRDAQEGASNEWLELWKNRSVRG